MHQKEHPSIILRDATAADAGVLSQLAWAGKESWGYPAQWMAAWRDALTLTPQYIELNDVFCGEEAGQTIGCVAFQQMGDELWLDHFWLDLSVVGTGRGRALFRLSAQHAQQRGVPRFLIESDPNAEGFYLRMGCCRVGTAVSRLTGNERMLPVLSYDLAASPIAG